MRQRQQHNEFCWNIFCGQPLWLTGRHSVFTTCCVACGDQLAFNHVACKCCGSPTYLMQMFCEWCGGPICETCDSSGEHTEFMQKHSNEYQSKECYPPKEQRFFNGVTL